MFLNSYSISQIQYEYQVIVTQLTISALSASSIGHRIVK